MLQGAIHKEITEMDDMFTEGPPRRQGGDFFVWIRARMLVSQTHVTTGQRKGHAKVRAILLHLDPGLSLPAWARKHRCPG